MLPLGDIRATTFYNDKIILAESDNKHLGNKLKAEKDGLNVSMI